MVRSFNESLQLDAELLFGPGVFIFPAAVKRDNSLAPVRRFSPRGAALVLKSVVPPRASSLDGVIQNMIWHQFDCHLRDGRTLFPATLELDMFLFEWYLNG